MTHKPLQKTMKAAKKACHVLHGALTIKPTIHCISLPALLLPSPAPSAPVSPAPVPLCALTPALAVTPSMPVKASRQKPFFPPATTTVNWVAFTQWATSLALSIGEDDNDLLFTGLGSVLPPMPLLPSNSWRRIAGEDWALTAPRCAGVTLTKVMAAESDVFGLECELEAKQQSVGDLKELSMWMTIGNDPDQVYPYDPAFNLDGVEKLNWEYYSCMTAVSLGRIHQLEHELEDADQLLASLFE